MDGREKSHDVENCIVADSSDFHNILLFLSERNQWLQQRTLTPIRIKIAARTIVDINFHLKISIPTTRLLPIEKEIF